VSIRVPIARCSSPLAMHVLVSVKFSSLNVVCPSRFCTYRRTKKGPGLLCTHLESVSQCVCKQLGICWIARRDQIAVLHHKRLPDASPVHEVTSLLEHLHRFIFHVLRRGSVVVSQSPEGQIIASAFQAFGQSGELSSRQHTFPCFRVDRPRQHQHAVTDGAYYLVVFEKLQGCMLHRFAFQVRFKCSLGSNRLGAGTQLPKDDACQQTRVGLRYMSCCCTERDLETGFSTWFPGESNLCSIEVPVGKRNEHLFLRRPTVLLSCCPSRWWHGLTKHTLLKTIPLS
jgi:hypothetical protein